MTLIKQRKAYSEYRLHELQRYIETFPLFRRLKNLCIYVTGSYGRLEAHPKSDLDLFVIEKTTKPYNKTQQILVSAEIIKLTKTLGFPDFSNNGQYIEFHSLQSILHHLGGREDDYQNLFTARLLLLLESRPVYNNKIYNEIINEIIHSYFRDYHDHATDFRPLFLANDIMRFWKTLCLNYEHKRNLPVKNFKAKQKSHLRNFKLKYSRILTCFSTLSGLGANRCSPDMVRAIVEQTPLERIQRITQEHKSELEPISRKIHKEYRWFLKKTAESDVRNWIGVKKNRNMAFDRAREFRNNMYTFLSRSSGGDDALKSLVI